MKCLMITIDPLNKFILALLFDQVSKHFFSYWTNNMPLAQNTVYCFGKRQIALKLRR